ncbi:TATA box-binding protein-associated factor RNA polymerase I subunit B-like [Ornithodoros turicata]|uniref:TATA box-binding protein-associated factor RNA polymerase I subunit B-like n=1 Tax=Ornithodoros turicata TaxID=34597 RepID=UPI00313965AA
MVFCVTCGGGNFEEIAGHFYCAECNTQSQELRVEELEENFSDQPSFGHGTHTPKKRGRGVDDVKREEVFSHEIFSDVLLAQLDVLEKLGASPLLREVVRTLWLTFLHRCELAFLSQNPDEDIAPRLGATNHQRDLLLSLKREPRENIRCALRALGIRTRVFQPKGRRSRTADVDYDEDNPPDEADEVPEEAKPKLYSDGAAEFLSWAKKHGVKTNKAQMNVLLRDAFLDLRKLLAFLHLGCLVAQEPILLGDLLFWAAQGHLPYQHPCTGHMSAALLHRAAPPKAPQVSYEAGRLARFLDSPKELDARPLQPLIARYVLDLNLPLEILVLSRWLLDSWPILNSQPWTSRKPLRSVAFPAEEVRATALLLVLLKLTLGLDGAREQELSLEADRINEASKLHLFSWLRWEKQERLRATVLTDCCFFPKLGDAFCAANLPSSASDRVTEGKDAALRQGMQSCLGSLRRKDHRVPLPPPSSFPFSADVKLHDRVYQRQDFTQDHVLYFLGVPLCGHLFDEVHADYWVLHSNQQYSLLIKPFLPRSFAWILKLLSAIIGCKCDHLYQEIVRVEKAIFFNKTIHSRFHEGWKRDRLYDDFLEKLRASLKERHCRTKSETSGRASDALL